MKVYIGPYRNWVGPYQIAEKIFFWVKKYDDKYNYTPAFERVHKFGEWLANDKNGDDSYLMKVCNWIHSKQHRKVKIEIHNYDHWNAHNTISMIALPILKDLRDNKQGSGFVDDEDVPDNLKKVSAESIDEDSGTDSNLHKRYEWMLDEVIWAFEQDQPDYDWEEQFIIEHSELDMTHYPEDEGKSVIPVRWKKEGKVDWDGRKKYQERIDNGFRLFGKYYQTFWS